MTFTVASSGSAFAWGNNTAGQLGNGTTTSSTSPVQVLGVGGSGTLSGVSSLDISEGSGGSFAVENDGSVTSWGASSACSEGGSNSPLTVPALSSVIGVAGQGQYVLKKDGSVWQCNTSNNTWVQVPGPGGSGFLTGVQAISGSAAATYALKIDGTLWALTAGYDQLLGNGTAPTLNNFSYSGPPVQVFGPGGAGYLTAITAVVTGGTHTLALKSDGTVYAWGGCLNIFPCTTDGELGNGTFNSSDVPVQVVGPGGTGSLTGVVALSAYSQGSAAVKSDGSVWTWGDDSRGQLGVGTFSSSGSDNVDAPVQVKGPGGTGFLTGIVSLSIATRDAASVLAVKNDGTVWGWGDDSFGQLGDKSTGSHQCGCQTTPVQAVGVGGRGTLSGITSVMVASGFTLAANTVPSNLTSVLPANPAPTDMQARVLDYVSVSDEPVQTLTGAYLYSHTDISIPGRGPSPTLVRSYSSNDPRDSALLGPGWTDNYAINLGTPDDGTQDIILEAPDGRSDRYTYSSGNYTPPRAVYTTLVKNGDGTYTATLPDQTTWSFSNVGRLTAIKDRYGNQSTLTYDSSGRLSSVSDPAGRGSLTFAYNSLNDRLASVTDWLSPSRSVQFGYDTSGRLQTAKDRNGNTTTFAYDGGSQRITTITDANNHVAVTNTYDSPERVATQKDALGASTGQATTFNYVTNGDGTKTTTVTYPATSFDGFNPTAADTYDTQGRVTSRVSKPSSSETYTEQYAYDSNFNRTSVTDGRGNTTLFCYDTDYSGATISGSHGNLTRRIDPAPTSGANQPVALLRYDSKNNVVETVPPKGVASGTSVTCGTNLSSAVNAAYASDSTYDATSTLLQSVTRHYTDPDLGSQTAVTKYEFNDAANPGRVTRIIPPRGNTGGSPDYTYATAMTYFGSGTEAGMLQSVADAVGDTTTYTYDAVGRRLTMVDPDGNVSGGVPGDHTWQYTYDAEDHLRFLKAPPPTSGGSALSTESRYDLVGNKTAVIDPNGQVTKYVYDVRDQLSEVDQSPSSWTDPNVTPSPEYKTTYTYDNLGNMTRMLRDQGDSANERGTDYLFDGARHVRKEIQYPSWPSTSPTLTTTTTYDGNGNVLTLVDPLSRTTSYGYDAMNRSTSLTYSDGVTPNVTYSYDANGNRSSMVDGTGTTSYSYDELDHTLSVASPGSQTVGYRYDLDGNRTKLIYPDSTAVTYSFDKASRLASLADWANRNTSYQYLADGHVQEVTNPNSTTGNYTYDNAQRMTQVLNQIGSTTISQHTYTLDSVGNRTAVAETLAQVGGGTATNNVSYGYDKLYRLTSDGPTAYTYDPVGNRLSMGSTSYSYDRADRIAAAGTTSYTVDANGNTTARGSDTFAYDQANRLKSATVSGTTTTNAYDGDGKRTQQTVGNNPAMSYTYDPNRTLPVLLADGTLKYVWGLGLAYSVDASGNINVDHSDGVGSIRALTDGTGAVIQTYQTDAFGVATNSQGASTQPFGYAGEQHDADGLSYLRARFYDPSVGRFVSRDPLSGLVGTPVTLNRFTYGWDDPMSMIDPSGRSSSSVVSNPIKEEPDAANECLKSSTSDRSGTFINGLGCTGQSLLPEPIAYSVSGGGIAYVQPPFNPGGGPGNGGPNQARTDVRETMRDEGLTAEQAIAQYKRGSVLRRFPAQFLQSTIEEIEKAARSGDSDARSAIKLLTDSRFDK